MQLAGIGEELTPQLLAHPKADPVYNYLVRWQDGQIQAFSEGAFAGDHAFEILD